MNYLISLHLPNALSTPFPQIITIISFFCVPPDFVYK